MDKKSLRKQYLEKRSNLPMNIVEEKSDIITNRLLSLDIYKNSSFIMSYVSFRKEVRTKTLMISSLNKGKRIGVPITVPETKELIVSELKDFHRELSLGYYNILTPKSQYIRIVSPDIVNLVIVPGAVFDKDGYRVGYGGGYYDRFLKKLNKDSIKLGLAYDLQLTDSVPKDDYDIPVDYILTESQFIKC